MTHPKPAEWAHQSEWFERTKELPAWGLFWEQGCGKTRPTIKTASHLYHAGEIDCVIVVASNGVHLNWATDELPAWNPPETAERSRVQVWSSRTARHVATKGEFEQLLRHDGLAWFMISFDGFMTEMGKKAVWKLMLRRKCMIVVDEAHNIKTPGAKRTKSIIAGGSHVRYRRVLTGTPTAGSPFDVYSQVRFLDPDFWPRHGFGSYMAYKAHFGIWEKGYNAQHGREYDRLVEYRRLDELADMLKEISCRVLKEDVLDLPPKLYSKRTVEMNPTQWKAYNDLERDFLTELEDGTLVDGTLAIVRLMRFQQITSGYLPGEDDSLVPLGNSCPRLEAMEDIRDNASGKYIVWSRFTQDVDRLMDLLPNAVRYDGKCTDVEKARAKEALQRGDAQWLVGNQEAGSEGLTLHAAETMIYYANSPKLIKRLQSEDRTHRGGMPDRPARYIDFVAQDTIDEAIVDNLRNRREIARIINGDKLREWI